MKEILPNDNHKNVEEGVRTGAPLANSSASEHPKLTWRGKTDAPPRTVEAPRLIECFGHGEELGRLYLADSGSLLDSLIQQGLGGKVDLVYIDPPFGGGSLYTRRVQLHGIDASTAFNVPAYQDIWSDAGYLQFMYERLQLLKTLLSETGSLYLHVDTSQSHYLKVLCDEVFGRENFQREIIWRIGWVSGYKTQAKNWIRNHDTILFYSKNPENFYFQKQYAPYAPGYKRRGGMKPKGKGHPVEDTWNCSEQDRLDSIQIKSFSGEKTGYPTQKNEALLERIISASCPEGGLVLDCFAGSGTTAYVARRMSRRWITGDVNPESIHTVRTRMLADGSGQLSGGFGVYSLEKPSSAQIPKADVTFSRQGSQVDVEIQDFLSPSLVAAMKNCRKKPSEWRSIVDGVLIDLNYDGTVFRMDFADIPAKAEQTVQGIYRPRSSGRIAVKIIDLLGNETVVSEPR